MNRFLLSFLVAATTALVCACATGPAKPVDRPPDPPPHVDTPVDPPPVTPKGPPPPPHWPEDVPVYREIKAPIKLLEPPNRPWQAPERPVRADNGPAAPDALKWFAAASKEIYEPALPLEPAKNADGSRNFDGVKTEWHTFANWDESGHFDLTCWAKVTTNKGEVSYSAHGPIEMMYHGTRHVAARGYAYDGNLYGPIVYFHDNGKPSEIGLYARGGAPVAGFTFHQWDVSGTHSAAGEMTGSKAGKRWTYSRTGKWFFWDERGSLSREVEFVHGDATGAYIEYEPDGHVRRSGRAAKGVMEGECMVWQAADPPFHIATYANAKLNGWVTAYRKDGTRWYDAWFKDDVREGWSYVWLDQKLTRRAIYADNRESGYCEYYNAGADTWSHGMRVDGRWEGWIEIWSSDDRKLQAELYRRDPDQAWIAMFHPGGKLQSAGALAKDPERPGRWKGCEGTWAYWDESGRTTEVAEWLNGRREGVSRLYHPSGKVNEEQTWRRGELEGPWQSFDESGVPRGSGAYLGGRKTGPWSTYEADGTRVEAEYFNGEETGTRTVFNKDGGKVSVREAIKDSDSRRETRFWPNGRVQAQGETKYGMREGLWTEFDENGIKLRSIVYASDRPNGTAKFFRPDGTLEREGTLLDGRKFGPWNFYDEKGVKLRTNSFDEDAPAGDQTEYYPDGKPRVHYVERRGIRTGLYEEWAPGGKRTIAGNYGDDGKKNGVWQLFDADGVEVGAEEYAAGGVLTAVWKRIRPCIAGPGEKIDPEQPNGAWQKRSPDGVLQVDVEFINGRATGTMVEWHPNGKKASETEYVDGQMHGRHSVYNDQGVKVLESNYDKGTPNGIIREWWPGGAKLRTQQVVRGIKEGALVEWFENGNVARQGQFTRGVQTGVWSSYYESGSPREECTFNALGEMEGTHTGYFDGGKKQFEGGRRAGRKVGDWREWHSNGRVKTEEHYDIKCIPIGRWRQFNEAGVQVGEAKSYDSNGNLIERATYDDAGKLTGTFTTWYSSGQKAIEGEYKAGLKAGEWSAWYPNGRRKSEEHYDDAGTPTGTWRTWNERGVLATEDKKG